MIFVSAICIVAEQTFTESAAISKVLRRACSVALKAYLGSDLERDVKRAIAQVPPEDLVRDGPSIPKLVEITRSRCLRMSYDSISGILLLTYFILLLRYQCWTR